MSAVCLCADVARLTEKQWAQVDGAAEGDGDAEPGTDTANGPYTTAELSQIRDVMKVAVLYALAYLYEHREEADHHSLVLTLRSLLFSIREGVL